MSHVPAKMSTTPAQRSWPNAARPAARKVSPRPTTVTWFGVRGVRPNAAISASACLRTQASNRVVNTAYLQRRQGFRGECPARVLIDVDDLGSDQLPRVAARLLERVVAKPRAQLRVASEDDERGGQLAPVLRRHRDAVPPRLQHRHIAGHLCRHD